MTTILLGSLILLFMSILASMAFGSRNISLHNVIHILLNADKSTLNGLVVHERIPRTVFSIIAGAALGISGTLMQSVTRNPIADPSILGVNTGASLFVVVGITFFHISTAGQYIWFALIGATIVAIFVYVVGSFGSGGASPIKLALAGTATSAALSSLVTAIILPRTDVLNAFRFWQVGSVSGASWQGILSILPFIAVGLLIAIIVAPALNVMALGDELAASLGVKVGVVRMFASFSGVLLCGATTALAGPIGFIGLMVPHILRMICGPNLKSIVPLSTVVGAIVLTIADVIGRMIGSPGELEAGIVTAFVGAPILIFIAIREKVHSI